MPQPQHCCRRSNLVRCAVLACAPTDMLVHAHDGVCVRCRRLGGDATQRGSRLVASGPGLPGCACGRAQRSGRQLGQPTQRPRNGYHGAASQVRDAGVRGRARSCCMGPWAVLWQCLVARSPCGAACASCCVCGRAASAVWWRGLCCAARAGCRLCVACITRGTSPNTPHARCLPCLCVAPSRHRQQLQPHGWHEHTAAAPAAAAGGGGGSRPPKPCRSGTLLR
jgi:hypothetical protein